MSKIIKAKPFGGRIIYTKALRIQTLEATNYSCAVSGTSIEIKPIGSPPGTPTSYLIPSGTISKTKTTPMASQLILGKYSGKTPITCTYKGYPPNIQIVNLDNITLFGTSKGVSGGGSGKAAKAAPASPASNPGSGSGAVKAKPASK